MQSLVYLIESQGPRGIKCAALALLLSCSGGTDGIAGNILPDTRVTRVTIEPGSAVLAVGGAISLSARAFNAAGGEVVGQAFTWSSSSTAIANVSASGQVTAVAQGAATITAMTAGVSGTSTITVTGTAQDTVVANVTMTPSSATILTGATVSLSAVATNASGQTLGGRSFTWTSASPSIAAVNASGVVTGVAMGGPVTVTAATGGKSATSSITVSAAPTSSGTITVNGAQQFQTITGWEALSGTGHGECDPRARQTYLPIVIDRAANELGINRLRVPLRAGFEGPVDAFLQFEAGQITFDQWKLVMFVPQNDNNDPFVINPSGFNWGFLDYTIESLVLPLKQKLKARGDDLWFNFSYTGANTGILHRDNPDEYAELALAAFLHMQQKYGFVPNSLELVNEPNLGGWNAQQVGANLVAAKRRLNAAGFYPEFVGPTGSGSAVSIQYFDAMVQIPGVAQALNEISYHRFGLVTPSDLQGLAQRGQQYGMRTAMLEHGGSGYQDLHQDLTLANASAWQQFGLAFCNTIENGGKYFGVSGAAIGQNSPVVVTMAMTKFLRQYFRYVGLRAVRLGAATADSRFSPLAFRNVNGKYVVVVNASTGGSFTVGGLPAGTYGIDYTTANDYMRPLPDVTISSSQSISTAIPTTGVLTIFAK